MSGERGRRRKPVKGGALGAFWRRIRMPLAKSSLVKGATVSVIAGFLRLVRWTTRPVDGSLDEPYEYPDVEPFIITMWHGQHLLAPVVYNGRNPAVVMVSRSADAELNAKVIERFGIGTVRGSGGREGAHNRSKGGARALIGLKKALDAGKNVAMIADIPHGTPRDSGHGIVLLASISGRPIVPVAIATSRRRVIQRTWDKMAVNLPFGRRVVAAGDPIYVPADADETTLEAYRLQVTGSLDAVTERAYRMVDAA